MCMWVSVADSHLEEEEEVHMYDGLNWINSYETYSLGYVCSITLQSLDTLCYISIHGGDLVNPLGTSFYIIDKKKGIKKKTA